MFVRIPQTTAFHFGPQGRHLQLIAEATSVSGGKPVVESFVQKNKEEENVTRSIFVDLLRFNYL